MSQAWRAIVPAENADSAREVSEEIVVEYGRVAKALGLRYNRDEKSRKVYLGMPARPAEVPVNSGRDGKDFGVLYPSGVYLERHPENNAARYAPGDPQSASPLVKGPASTKIGPNFTLGEFACHDQGYTGVRVHPNLVKSLEKIRAKVGKAVRITSGYRPPDYNRAIGGASMSQHLDGLAADIYVDGVSSDRLYEIAEAVIGSGGGVGYYATFVHVDVRGYYARWSG